MASFEERLGILSASLRGGFIVTRVKTLVNTIVKMTGVVAMTRFEKLEEARKYLNAWMQAELHLATGQEFRMGTRTLRMPDLTYVKNQILFWEKRVAALEGVKGRRTFRVIPCDR